MRSNRSRCPRLSTALATLLVAAGALGQPAAARAADPPSADEVVRQMRLALEPPKTSVRTMTMVFDDRGTKTTFQLAQARKPKPDRSLTVLLEPEDARGIAYLVARQPGEEASEWIYVPLIRRVRHLVPAENYQTFLDTDFTYGDLGLLPIDTENKLLGTEQVEGRKAYKVESIPGSAVKQWYYARIVTLIDADMLLPIRREFYSPAGELFKVETFGAVTRVDGIPTPLEIVMTNVGTDTSTTLTVTGIDYETEVPDSLFEPKSLPAIADADYWKKQPTKVQPGNPS